MKIVVSHVYSNDNKGDAALLSVLLSDIRRAFDDPQITILTMDAIKKDETFDGVPMKNSFMYYASSRYQNPLLKIIYDFFLAISTLAWAGIYRYTKKSIPLPNYLQDIASLYQDADLIIPVGGGYIRSVAGLRNTAVLFFVIHPFLFSYILRKPTIAYTQSVGPFGDAFQEYMAKFAVKRLDGIVVREKISLALLQKWGITKNVFLSVDSGFSFTSDRIKDLRKELGISKQQILVGVTVRNWLRKDEQLSYEVAIAKLCDYIVEKYDAIIVFIPQVTVESHNDDDRESSQRVYRFMEHKKNIHVMIEQYDHHVIKAIYGNLDYLVGTRFHSVIFALTSYVPAIAIGYEYKTRGIMADLGLEEWVVDIQTAHPTQLMHLFDKLILGRYVYINQLKKILPRYIEQAKSSIYFVREIYEN